MGRGRILLIACAAVASIALSASHAGAAVTIGQTGPETDGCSRGYEFAQLTVTSGNSYFVPQMPPATALSITSWSHHADTDDAGRSVKLRVYRPVAGSTFTVIGQDVGVIQSPGVLNTFPTSIPVQAGDTIGIMGVPFGGPLFSCGFGPPGETAYDAGLEHPIGSQLTFSSGPGFRLNVSAVVEPTNTFSFGPTTRNKKKGTATLTLNLPNPGDLAAVGNGLKGAVTSDSSATAAQSVAAGAVKLKIRAKGKKLAKLNRTGKVKLKPSITYAPAGGAPTSQSTKVKLKKAA